MNGPLWESHAPFPTPEEAEAAGLRRPRLEAARRHILARRRGEGHQHPDRYWWHQAVAEELRDYGPMPVGSVGGQVCVDAERYVRAMVPWGEVEWVADGWVHLRGVTPNHGAHLKGAA